MKSDNNCTQLNKYKNKGLPLSDRAFHSKFSPYYFSLRMVEPVPIISGGFPFQSLTLVAVNKQIGGYIFYHSFIYPITKSR